MKHLKLISLFLFCLSLTMPILTNASEKVGSMENRSKVFKKLNPYLGNLDEPQLRELLQKTESKNTSIGGTSFVIKVEGTPVFVKKVALTDLEMLPKNKQSTRNIFNLPLFYQYGVGSTGFGAWRELAAHEMTTQWVLQGKTPNFPILYHSRVLKREEPISTEPKAKKSIEEITQYWENDPNIRKRLEGIQNASHELVLFLEFVPYNLSKWMRKELPKAKNPAHVVDRIYNQLTTANDFMRSQGFMHFDAHFQNILTNGDDIFFTDFGLAISEQFELSEKEKSFFKEHIKTYDQVYSVVNSVREVLSSFIKRPKGRMSLREILELKDQTFPSSLEPFLQKHLDVALKMDDFLVTLFAKSKLTPYPREVFENLIEK